MSVSTAPDAAAAGARAFPATFRKLVAAAAQRESPEEALDAVLSLCTEDLCFRYACFALPSPQDGEERAPLGFVPHPSIRLSPASGPAELLPRALYRLDMTENLVVRTFLEGSPRLTTCWYDVVRPHVDAPAAAALQQALGVAAMVLLPLPAAGQPLGVLALASGAEHPVAETDLPTLELFAGVAALAVQNARLRQDLRDREQQVSLLLKATIEAQEEEQERICLEIHDGVAQMLAPAFHYLQTLEGRAELPEDLRSNVRRASTLVRDAAREAREVIASLRPAALDTVGLAATLRHELEDLSERVGWEVYFDMEYRRFPKAVETALYRILHEAVTNVAKHASAHQVLVRVKQEQGHIVAEVRDNGVGFDPQARERPWRRQGVGLLSMRKRTELLQGRFEVTSSPGGGTRVRIEVPLLGPDP